MTSAALRSTEVQVQGLRKTYGDTAVVDGVSFRLEPGTITGFVGPNGSGKTTTLKLMLGLVRGKGSTLFGGRPLHELDSPQAVVGAMFDGRIGHPKVTAERHLRAIAALQGIATRRIALVLDQVGLTESALERTSTFSLGMAQRLSAAALLLAEPAVLIVDEPTNALDPEGVLMVREIVRRCADRGGTVLFSSHLLAEVETISDRFMVISRGAIVADAKAAEFQHVYGNLRVIVRVERGDGVSTLLHELGHPFQRLGDRHYAVKGTQAQELGPALHRSGIAVCELRDEYQPLEELFFQVTGLARPAAVLS